MLIYQIYAENTNKTYAYFSTETQAQFYLGWLLDSWHKSIEEVDKKIWKR